MHPKCRARPGSPGTPRRGYASLMPSPLMTPRALARVTIAALAIPALLTGCVDANNRLAVGSSPTETIKFEAISGSQPLAAGDAAPSDTAFQRADDAPSVVSLDRANWDSRVLAQPVDYTLHRPHYRVPTRYPNKIARERGDYPTAETALDLACRSDGQQAWQALGAPLGAFVEGLSIPVRLIFEPQCGVWRSPDLAYDRVPPAAPPAAPVEAPPGADTTPVPGSEPR